ncbi:MAG: SDR family oxidoreductase [Rhodospirillaceae bacterium]
MPKSVLVTGGAKRLGRAIALDLAAAGWDILLHHHHSLEDAEQTQTELRALGVQADLIACDLADSEAVEALCDRITEAVPQGLSALVNCASYFVNDAALKPDPTLFHQAQAVNLLAPIRLGGALAAALIAQQQQGSIVNLLDNKLKAINPDFFSYTLSKAGLAAATEMAAMAFAPHVRVNGVAPGLTLISGKQSQAAFDRAFGLTPLGRSSTPADIARSVRFLLESQTITGRIIVADGGASLTALPRDVAFLPGIGETLPLVPTD